MQADLVLASDDVIDRETQPVNALRHEAVLARELRTFPYGFVECCFHRSAGVGITGQ